MPTYSVLLTVTTSWLLGLVNIGSTTALSDILSLAVSGLYSSYLLTGSLLLYRRVMGHIADYEENDDMTINVPGAKLVWGPFHIPGIWGILLNVYAVIYMIIVVFFSFWPTQMHPTASTMNYAVVGTVGVIILAVLYYLLRARHIYKGPVIESFL